MPVYTLSRLAALALQYGQGGKFNDDIFERTCHKIRNRKEARVVQDISRLIVPSAETMALYGNKSLDNLVETISEM